MMRDRGHFEYWPEFVLLVLMLSVLVLNFTVFDSLWLYGEDGGQPTQTVVQPGLEYGERGEP